MSKQNLLSVIAIAALLTACGGGGDGDGGGSIGGGGGGTAACTSSAQRQFVFDVMQDWYFFQDLLPAGATPNSASTPEGLVDLLAAEARAQGKDRFFSGLTTISADQAFFGEGQFPGFGFGSRPEQGGMRVTQVIPGSPAANAGFERGQVVLSIDGTAVTTSAALNQAAGPPEAGVTRTFRIRRGDGGEFEVSVTKAIVTTVPVPTELVLTQPGTPGVAYIDFRTFISTADPVLNDLFGDYADQGITDFVIDLRYNGGGLLSTARTLGNLLGGIAAQNEVFYELRFNPARSVNNELRRFARALNSVNPARVVFITSGGSASASELVINSLKPHVQLALVGARTFGKPVGQSAFDLEACNLRLRPVTFDIANSDGDAEYFDGLPVGSQPVLCPAADDLDFELGDPREASLATALDYLSTGACPVTASGPAMLESREAPGYAPNASHAQVYLGVY